MKCRWSIKTSKKSWPRKPTWWNRSRNFSRASSKWPRPANGRRIESDDRNEFKHKSPGLFQPDALDVGLREERTFVAGHMDVVEHGMGNIGKIDAFRACSRDVFKDKFFERFLRGNLADIGKGCGSNANVGEVEVPANGIASQNLNRIVRCVLVAGADQVNGEEPARQNIEVVA